MPQITGRVYDQDSGQGVGGVQVSNGEDVVQSEADSIYVRFLDAGAHAFVWITTPEGYRPSKGFFRRAPAAGDEPNFALTRAPERGNRQFRAAQITDTHVVLGGSGVAARGASRCDGGAHPAFDRLFRRAGPL